MLENNDKRMKIERKEGKNYISRSYARYLVWVYIVEFCNNRFGRDYLIDNENYVEITKIYNEYLTLKNRI
jgi:hypothetical protein